MKSDRPALATQNKLPNSIRCWPLADKFISTEKHKLLSSWSMHWKTEPVRFQSVISFCLHAQVCMEYHETPNNLEHIATNHTLKNAFFFWHVFLSISGCIQTGASNCFIFRKSSQHLSHRSSSLQVPDAQPSTVAVFSESAVKTFGKRSWKVSATSTESAPLFQLHQDLDVLPTHLSLIA